MRALLLAAVGTSIFLCSTTIFGYGHQGHEAVGYVAAALIKGTNAEKQLKKLLKPTENLAAAAEWADCAKGFTYCHVDPTPEMRDFAARNKSHHNYHYTDVPFQLGAYQKGAVGTTSDDVVNILEDAILVLRGHPPANPAHDVTKREALFILAHMTGDIHQPLHVGAGYVSEDDEFFVPQSETEAMTAFTQGGNLLCDKSKGLHSKWDTDYVVKAMKAAHTTTSQEFANFLLAKAKKVKGNTGAAGTWPGKWATDTLRLALLELEPIAIVKKRTAGPGRSPCAASAATPIASVWNIELPDDYAGDSALTVNDQLAKAGARLASLLKAIWP